MREDRARFRFSVGMAAHPRTAAQVSDGFALAQSTSHSGKRLRISSMAMRSPSVPAH